MPQAYAVPQNVWVWSLTVRCVRGALEKANDYIHTYIHKGNNGQEQDINKSAKAIMPQRKNYITNVSIKMQHSYLRA